jgi:hypothetical protein
MEATWRVSGSNLLRPTEPAQDFHHHVAIGRTARVTCGALQVLGEQAAQLQTNVVAQSPWQPVRDFLDVVLDDCLSVHSALLIE